MAPPNPMMIQRALCSLLFVVMLASSGCQKAPAPNPREGVAQRYVTKEEMADFEAALEARLAPNKERECPRPLRQEGEAASIEARQAFFEGQELTTCIEALQAHGLKEALVKEEEYELEPGTSTILREVVHDPLDESLEACRLSCVQVTEQLDGLVAGAEGCSPYLLGIKAEPKIGKYRWLMRAVQLELRALHAKGDLAGGMALAIDALHYSQDLYRGGASLLLVGASLRAQQELLSWFARFSQNPALSQEEAARFGKELEALTQNPPDLYEILRAELDVTLLNAMLPIIKGPEWTPPGGFADTTKDGLFDEEDSIGLGWLALERVHEWVANGCKAKTIKDCQEALQKLSYLKEIENPEDREHAVGKMMEGTGRALRPYALHYGRILSVLQAQAFLLAARAKGGACPHGAALNQALQNEALGDGIVAEPGEEGLLLHPPLWLGRGSRPIGVLRCAPELPGEIEAP